MALCIRHHPALTPVQKALYGRVCPSIYQKGLSYVGGCGPRGFRSGYWAPADVGNGKAAVHVTEKLLRNESSAEEEKGRLQRSLATLDWNFCNHTEAYRSRTFLQLVRAYLVFGLCGVDVFTRNNQSLMLIGRRVLGQTLFQKLMQSTFYGHFVAGEHAEAVKPMLKRNLDFGVNAILYYSMEEDIRHQRNAVKKHPLERLSASTSNPGKYQANVQKFLHSVDVIADATGARGGGCIAIKPSALAAPELWLNLANVVDQRNKLFDMAFVPNHDGAIHRVNLSSFTAALPLLGLSAEEEQKWIELFHHLDSKHHRGWIHRFQFNDLLDAKMATTPPSIYPLLDEASRKEALDLLERATCIVQHAKSRGIAVMVDAEQSYFQPAIARLLGIQLMKTFNREGATVYSTYQTYLKATRDVIMDDMAFARHEGFCLGARVVRGAYLQQEREHALKYAITDPTNQTFEATSSTYHDVITSLLSVAATSPDEVEIMAATHNEDTIKFVLNKMKDLSVPLSCVSFGQLYGMSDHISFSLGQAGFRTYKSVPYGPVELVFSYLGRRALENAGVLRKASKERFLLQKELASRVRQKLRLA